MPPHTRQPSPPRHTHTRTCTHTHARTPACGVGGVVAEGGVEPMGLDVGFIHHMQAERGTQLVPKVFRVRDEWSACPQSRATLQLGWLMKASWMQVSWVSIWASSPPCRARGVQSAGVCCCLYHSYAKKGQSSLTSPTTNISASPTCRARGVQSSHTQFNMPSSSRIRHS